MPLPTPQDVAADWVAATAAAVPKYTRGVQAVQTAPGAAAARQVQKYVSKVQEKANDWAAAVGAVSLAEWQAVTVEKGGARIAGGVQAAQGKMEGFMAELLPHIARGQAGIAQMPSMTLQDSKNRAVAWIDHMATFKRSRR